MFKRLAEVKVLCQVICCCCHGCHLRSLLDLHQRSPTSLQLTSKSIELHRNQQKCRMLASLSLLQSQRDFTATSLPYIRSQQRDIQISNLLQAPFASYPECIADFFGHASIKRLSRFTCYDKLAYVAQSSAGADFSLTHVQRDLQDHRPIFDLSMSMVAMCTC